MAPKPQFEARYTLTFPDFEALCDARVLWKPAWRQPRWLHWLMMAVIAAAGLFLISAGDPLFGGLALAAVVLIIGLDVVFQPWARKRSFREQGLEDLDVRLTANDEACHIVSEKTDSRLAWHAIQRVDHFREHIILWTTKNFGIVVPERGFASPDAASSFLSFAQEKTAGQTNQD